VPDLKQRLIDLPEKGQWGLMIYVVFIAFLYLPLYERGASPLEWSLTTAAVAVFVGLYISVFRLKGTQLFWVVGCDVLLGIAFAPFNAAASIFFVYAASFVPFALQGRPRQAAGVIALRLPRQHARERVAGVRVRSVTTA
jgi:hypothetical protein